MQKKKQALFNQHMQSEGLSTIIAWHFGIKLNGLRIDTSKNRHIKINWTCFRSSLGFFGGSIQGIIKIGYNDISRYFK